VGRRNEGTLGKDDTHRLEEGINKWLRDSVTDYDKEFPMAPGIADGITSTFAESYNFQQGRWMLQLSQL
jgi:hypothetical protein